MAEDEVDFAHAYSLMAARIQRLQTENTVAIDGLKSLADTISGLIPQLEGLDAGYTLLSLEVEIATILRQMREARNSDLDVPEERMNASLVAVQCDNDDKFYHCANTCAFRFACYDRKHDRVEKPIHPNDPITIEMMPKDAK